MEIINGFIVCVKRSSEWTNRVPITDANQINVTGQLVVSGEVVPDFVQAVGIIDQARICSSRYTSLEGNRGSF